MTNLIPVIRDHFSGLFEHYTTFSRMGIQLEGWVKGEFLHLMAGLEAEGKVEQIDREVALSRTSRRKVDFLVRTGGLDH